MLGKDQSPTSGQSATRPAAASTPRQGRSSSTTSFTASLIAYAATVPRPIRAAPATPRASFRRIAVHPTRTSNSPRTTSVASVATARSGPTPDGACATISTTRR
nr:hypothetical protein [Cryptosporangium arvum]